MANRAEDFFEKAALTSASLERAIRYSLARLQHTKLRHLGMDLAELGDQVWFDVDNNGSFDAGTPSLPGSQVSLDTLVIIVHELYRH